MRYAQHWWPPHDQKPIEVPPEFEGRNLSAAPRQTNMKQMKMKKKLIRSVCILTENQWCGGEGLVSLTSEGPFPNSNFRVSGWSCIFRSHDSKGEELRKSHIETMRKSHQDGFIWQGMFQYCWWFRNLGCFFSPVNSRINYRTTYELVSRISSINSIIAFHGNIEFHQPRLYRKPGEAVAEAMDEEEAVTLNGARTAGTQRYCKLDRCSWVSQPCNSPWFWCGKTNARCRLMKIH